MAQASKPVSWPAFAHHTAAQSKSQRIPRQGPALAAIHTHTHTPGFVPHKSHLSLNEALFSSLKICPFGIHGRHPRRGRCCCTPSQACCSRGPAPTCASAMHTPLLPLPLYKSWQCRYVCPHQQNTPQLPTHPQHDTAPQYATNSRPAAATGFQRHHASVALSRHQPQHHPKKTHTERAGRIRQRTPVKEQSNPVSKVPRQQHKEETPATTARQLPRP